MQTVNENSSIKVKLLTYTPNPENIIATAARLCYSNCNVEDLFKNLSKDETSNFIHKLVCMGHESPFEHVTFTFAIEGISRACSHQLVRHRIASYSQQSQRYVSMDNFDYITPPVIYDNEELNTKYSKIMEDLNNSYKELQSILADKLTLDFINSGIEEKKARSKANKLANEDARYILPNACTTKIMVTMNVRSLYNFFNHRLCNRAQWEIRNVAEKMYNEVYNIAPILFSNIGPKCVTTGKCPEGNMSCGKIKFMIKKYKNNNIVS